MIPKSGWCHFETPEDLFLKLRHDHQRLASNPLDAYAALDFLVPATHRSGTARQVNVSISLKNPRDKALVDSCEHLGNGAKHFFTDQKR
jgi:hypothetical protein